jgi:hypothetical protein
MGPKAKPRSVDRYDVHPSVAMAEKIVGAMKEKTGRSLDEWVRFVVRDGPPGATARREWLKTEHGLGTNYAGFVADRSSGKGFETSAEAYLAAAPVYVDEMFSGARADLRSIFEEIVRLGRALGEDVRVSPAKTIVPLYRNHVFAQIRPATRTRVDLGLALGDAATPARLVDTGGFAKKDRITRRFEIASLDDLDDEVRRWMRVAYEMDA